MVVEQINGGLGARRRKALGITDSEEPPGQGTAETLHTLQTMLLKLIRREETNRLNQNLGLHLLRETLIEARAGREVYFEDIVERPWLEKGKTLETMSNYFELKTRDAIKHVDDVIEKIKKEEADRRSS